MGGSKSKYNRSGGLYIQVENTSCFSGQEIQGMIHLSIKSPMNPSTLFLIFKGKEVTHWEETRTISESDGRGGTRTWTHREYHNGKAKVCNFHYPIYNFNQVIAPGGFSLPFVFRLPPNLPGSFFYQSGTTKAFIEYKFHAKLKSIDHDIIKGRIGLNIRQAVYSYNANLALNKIARMKVCCCNKGNCKINVVHQQDTYNPSQVAVVSVEIDNSDSKLPVRSITARLFYSLRIKSNSGKTHFVSTTLISQSVPIRIAVGAALLNSSAAQISLNLPSQMNVLANMYSTKGQLIDCMYTIEVRADMDGMCMCCGESPNIQTIMNIVPNMVIAPSAPVAPPDWNPSVLESVNLQYDPRYEVIPSAPLEGH